MAIVPTGKIRLMEAQTVGNPLLDTNSATPMGGDTIGEEPTPEISPETGVGPEMQDTAEGIAENQQEEPVMERGGEGKTLSDYIFKKLQSYGYPPRRLEEFKKKFVDQDISADGTENIRVEIPDKYYPNPQTGEAKTIESHDLKSIIREVGKNFGLNFNGANRSEGKWTINFTSAKVGGEEEEAGLVRDNLDEVYGTPSKGKAGTGKGRGRPARAFTIQEMIKATKNKIYNKLKKVIGETDAS